METLQASFCSVMLCGKNQCHLLWLGFDTKFSWSLQYKKLADNSLEKAKLRKEITDTMLHRQHLDGSVDAIGVFLFGPTKGSSVLNSVRKPGLPLVDDWDCLKSTVIWKSMQLFDNCWSNLTWIPPWYNLIFVFFTRFAFSSYIVAR